VAIGFVVLSGWALDISLFKSVLPGLAAMQPMTAGGMIVGGAGLAWLNPADDRETGWGAFLSLVAGIVLTVLSTAVLNEYVWNTDLLIDWLLFPDAIARWPIAHPGRMAPSTAFTFLLAGLCLLSARLPSFRPRLYNLFASTGLVIPAMGLMGYAYSVDALYSFGPFKTMALHTAVSFFFLFIGLLAARPHWSWVHFLTAGDFGSMVVRRLVPFAIGVPLVVGWVMLQASRLTGMHPDFRLVVVALVAAGMLLLAAIWSTRQLSGLARQRDRLETSLRTSEERLILAHEAAGAGAWDWDIRSGDIIWSEAGRRLYWDDDSTAATDIGAWKDCLHAEDRDRVETEIRRVLTEGRPLDIEFRIVRPDGMVRWVASRGRVFHDADGEATRMIGLNLDITERIQAALELRRAKSEAERANIAKSKFLAAASHDLRQPVQGLMLFAAALGDRLRDHPGRAIVDAMQQSLDALKMLLDALLDISRLDAGLVVPQTTAMALMPLLDRLKTEYDPRAEKRGLRLLVVDTGYVVRSDPALLERMLRSLIENALRYTEQGGVVVGCRPSGDRIRIEVIDSGIGIETEKLEEIFDEFFQIGNSERDRTKGLGLGLAVVRRLGRLLGHTVTVRSWPGHGSRFGIEVPRVAQADAVRPKSQAVNDDVRGLTLVIDDEVLVRMGFKAMLESWGYEVLTAESADEAIESLIERDRRPDIIIADYRLRAGRTGTQAIETVHAYCGQRIPALIITGDTAPERIAEAERGGFGLLHKPVGADELRRAVGRMIPAM
jgi:signal transduction histidine kinase/ActR/RegA family two-component response regulator